MGHLTLEIEQLNFGTSCKALVVCTGKLPKIYPAEVSQFLIQKYCNNYGPVSEISSTSEKSEQNEAYLKQILNNVFKHTGYSHLASFLKK